MIMERRDVLKWMGTAVTSATLQPNVAATMASQTPADTVGSFAFATAAVTADAIRKKRISARELLNITFQRIDRYNPRLNAIIWQFREQAVMRATQADEALARGKPWGELH